MSALCRDMSTLLLSPGFFPRNTVIKIFTVCGRDGSLRDQMTSRRFASAFEDGCGPLPQLISGWITGVKRLLHGSALKDVATARLMAMVDDRMEAASRAWYMDFTPLVREQESLENRRGSEAGRVAIGFQLRRLRENTCYATLP